MLESRFFLGVGSGENLNEHILGDRWPPAAIKGEAGRELPMPGHFAQLAEMVSPGRFEEAGYTHIYVHQIGPDQEGFLDFYKREILPRFS